MMSSGNGRASTTRLPQVSSFVVFAATGGELGQFLHNQSDSGHGKRHV